MLKAGKTKNFFADTDTMAWEIEDAMKDEWADVKNYPLPAPLGEEDRRILFVAIARGVLRYLWNHRDEISTTVVNDKVSGHQHTLQFDIEAH